jgi:hypothetical protein
MNFFLSFIRLSLNFFIIPFVTISLFSSSSPHLQIKAGLQDFSFYAQGAIRLHYNSASLIQNIGYIGPGRIQYAAQTFNYDKQQLVKSRLLQEQTENYFSQRSVFYYKYIADNRQNNKSLISKESQYYGFTIRELNYFYDTFQRLSSIESSEGAFFLKKKESLKHCYSLNNRLETTEYFNSLRQPIVRYEWDYDSLGAVVTQKAFKDDLLLWHKIYAYNIEKSIETIISNNSQGLFLLKEVNYKNSLNQLTKVEIFDQNNLLLHTTEYRYDPQLRLTEIVENDRNQNIVGFQSLFYDDLNRLYLREYNYTNLELAAERLKPHLMLPGNDL